MHDFWQIIVSNALVATALAIGTALLSRAWKNPAAIHLLWVVVLLKLFTPPLFTAELSIPAGWRLATERSNASNESPLALTAASDLSPTALATTPSPGEPSHMATANGVKPLGRDQSLSTAAIARRVWSLPNLLVAIWISGAVGVSI